MKQGFVVLIRLVGVAVGRCDAVEGRGDAGDGGVFRNGQPDRAGLKLMTLDVDDRQHRGDDPSVSGGGSQFMLLWGLFWSCGLLKTSNRYRAWASSP